MWTSKFDMKDMGVTDVILGSIDITPFAVEVEPKYTDLPEEKAKIMEKLKDFTARLMYRSNNGPFILLGKLDDSVHDMIRSCTIQPANLDIESGSWSCAE
ncbi:hypothetical protein RJ639_014425 [Escallonia herrerae]|uniref:Uncharacterized protein n=1 Tax=Escallonia herrerae TaxID=1293975 RepID=A0AA88VG69_9ASTE|nr:hypothetical protein RJ639_014425 [Escallonia herrerae]